MKFTLRKFILNIIPYQAIRFFRKKVNLNYFLFGPSVKNTGRYLICDDDFTFTLYGMEQQLGPEVSAGFRACYDEYMSRPGHMRKYLVEVDECYIEPSSGWGITAKDNKLVFDSISNNTWRETYHPSYFAYLRGKKDAVNIEEAVSINLIKGGEFNYWHFLHDLLGQVMIAKHVLQKDLPLIISKNLSERSYFKQAVAISPLLANCRWIIRDEKYLLVKKCFFVQTMPNSNEQFFDLRELLQVPDSDINKNRKIFLVRSKKRIRFLKNSEAIEAIAAKYGFEITDTDHLSLQEQIRLFGETRLLIGIHGAGLTNVFYRKNAPMSVLELLPGDYLQPHYFWLSKGMGHQYDCMVGSVAALDTSFEINPVLFEQKVIRLLETVR